MGEAIDLSLRHLSSEDIAALTRYLRTIPPQRSEFAAHIDHHPPALTGASAWSPGPVRTESIGLRIFASACASCHGWDGTGQQTNHAEFLGSTAVNDPSGVNLVRAVLEGIKIGSPRGDNLMPSFAAAYSDAEIAAVSNYVIGHFGGKQGSVTSADVRAARNCGVAGIGASSADRIILFQSSMFERWLGRTRIGLRWGLCHSNPVAFVFEVPRNLYVISSSSSPRVSLTFASTNTKDKIAISV
jgi:mono/diheme cytochrome c family protein